jgi:hypothetical protein
MISIDHINCQKGKAPATTTKKGAKAPVKAEATPKKVLTTAKPTSLFFELYFFGWNDKIHKYFLLIIKKLLQQQKKQQNVRQNILHLSIKHHVTHVTSIW